MSLQIDCSNIYCSAVKGVYVFWETLFKNMELLNMSGRLSLADWR